MRYTVKSSSQELNQSTTIRPSHFGGWMAVNSGTVAVSVDGYVLQPGDGIDYTHLHPSVTWDSPINIVIPVGGSVRFTRLMYNEVND